ncbi:MAG: protein translocase subunit SecF [Candidatus Dependentiae bacterium]
MINILQYRKLSAIVSLTILLAAGVLFVYRMQTRGYAFTYSVDFTGGTQILLKFNKDTTASDINSALNEEWPNAVLRQFEKDEYLVRVKEFSNDPQGLSARMVDAIKKAHPDYEITVLENEAVGAGVGQTLRYKSLMAIFYALLAMLGYIAVRFWSIGFAVGSVVALIHDALIMLAVFLIFGREISTNVIAAVLAVLGYSINDTIVIYSQIRENLKTLNRSSIYDIVNISLNQTMRRTLLTSISTGLTVGAMFVLGGEALRSFSLALLIGIVFGTYSSIFIASPIVMFFYRNKDKTVLQ